MVKMYKLTKGGQTIFPATIYDAVVNPKTRKTLATELLEVNNKIVNEMSELEQDTIDEVTLNALTSRNRVLDLTQYDFHTGIVMNTGQINTQQAGNIIYTEIQIPKVYRGSKLIYQSFQMGSINRGIAFYDSSDSLCKFEGLNKTEQVTTAIPDNATSLKISYSNKEAVSTYPNAYLVLKSDMLAIDDIQDYPSVKKQTDENTERLTGESTKTITSDQLFSGRIDLNGNVITHRTDKYYEFELNDLFKGGTITYPQSQFGNYIHTTILFKDGNNDVIYYELQATKPAIKTVCIPRNAVKIFITINISQYSEITYTIKSNSSLSLTGINRRIDLFPKTDKLPLGYMDNLLPDYIAGYGKNNSFVTNLYDTESRITVINDIQCGFLMPQTENNSNIGILRIKKGIWKRVCFRNTSGYAEFLDWNCIEGDSLKAVSGTGKGKILYVDDKYIIVHVNGMHWVRAFDNTQTTSAIETSGVEQLEWEADYCSVFSNEYSVDDVDINRRYYSRSEKLNSKIRGKNAIVYADSLAAFITFLRNDWGVNIWSFARGGSRMGYEAGTGQGGESGSSDSLWLCSDEFIQNFNANKPEKIDYIIFAAIANSKNRKDSNAIEVQFVLENKRWYGDNAETNPFDELSSENKLRFTNSACLYAASYALCKNYPYAVNLVVETYRTPGPVNAKESLGDNYSIYTPDRYAALLFNKNMSDVNSLFKEVAKNLGAIWVENKTRDSIANVPAYHPNDGVHPYSGRGVEEDLAANIASELNMILLE